MMGASEQDSADPSTPLRISPGDSDAASAAPASTSEQTIAPDSGRVVPSDPRQSSAGTSQGDARQTSAGTGPRRTGTRPRQKNAATSQADSPQHPQPTDAGAGTEPSVDTADGDETEQTFTGPRLAAKASGPAD